MVSFSRMQVSYWLAYEAQLTCLIVMMQGSVKFVFFKTSLCLLGGENGEENPQSYVILALCLKKLPK